MTMTVVDDYDVHMKKRRVLLDLDEDLVEALEAVAAGEQNVSTVANEALREPLESKAHRQALYDWMEELNEKHGYPSPEDFEWAKAVLEEARRPGANGSGAA